MFCRLISSTSRKAFLISNSREFATVAKMRALLLGAYQEKDGDLMLTPTAAKFTKSSNLLKNQCDIFKSNFKKGESRVLYGIHEEYPLIALVHLGSEKVGYNELEQIEELPENVRIAVAAGVKSLRSAGATQVEVDVCGQPQAAAEGSVLITYAYDELKNADSRKKPITLAPFGDNVDKVSWDRGVTFANCQNLARRLMETPANLMTPTIFAQVAHEALTAVGVEVIAHDRKWAEDKKMGSFLSVANGSAQPPIFLEMHYRGNPSNPNDVHALVGKGITFDTGGISLKQPLNMDAMRADMGGAACVVGTILGAATLRIPINIVGVTPLTENMPGGRATKPGDVVTAMNGTTIQIDNTDAEGRLVLADALCYAQTFKPKTMLDLATLTGAMSVALGAAATGTFSTSEPLWNTLWKCGQQTGDRVWRMPIFDQYLKQIAPARLADLNNLGKKRAVAGSGVAAAFLKEFVDMKNWAHLDIAGVMDNSDEVPYLCAGMAGKFDFLRFYNQKSAFGI